MKIYEIGTGYTPIPAQMGAATEIVVEELTKAFIKQGVSVEIIDIKAEKRQSNSLPIDEVWVPKCFSGTDVKLGILHKLKRVVYSICLAAKIGEILKRADDEVVLHFHNQYNMFFFLKLVPKRLRRKALTAYTVHSYVWPSKWEEIEAVVRKRYFQEIESVKNADCVFVLNEKTKEHFMNKFAVDSSRIVVVKNGVNTDVYHKLDPNVLMQNAKKQSYHGKKVILQVGSVCDRKNQLGAIKMLAKYLKEHRDVVYAYAGGIIDSKYQEEIIRYAQEQGIGEQISYVGEIAPGEELNWYYNLAAVTVFPSKVESFGLAIIESISAQTPVLMAEVPLFSLKSGYNVYHNADELIQYVDACLNSAYDYTLARNEVKSIYGWNAVGMEHVSVFKKIV